MFAGMVLNVGYGPAVADTPPAEIRPGSTAPNWFLRASFGAGSVPKSDQRDLLSLNGYEDAGIRWHFDLDGAGFPWEQVGLGGFVGYSTRRVEPEFGGPDMEEEVLRLGLQAPWAIGPEAFKFMLTPRLGLVHGQQSLHGDGDFVTGPLAGLNAGLVFPKIHLGFQLGYYYAPVPASGDLGERDDFGGLEFMLSVYFDG